VGVNAVLHTLANLLIALIALAHLGFLVLEMFYWDHPVGRRTFGLSPELSAASKTLAANQGLYNGFLVAGLVWALVSDQLQLKWFFLGCVLVAGLFGGLTAKRSILYIQALPAALALVLLALSG
jgi:putative membrane protein